MTGQLGETPGESHTARHGPTGGGSTEEGTLGGFLMIGRVIVNLSSQKTENSFSAVVFLFIYVKMSVVVTLKWHFLSHQTHSHLNKKS